MPTEIYRSPWFNLQGYLACTVDYSDDSRRTVLQHREKMEKKLNRRLDPKEHVHHKNGNRRDNCLSNLEVKSAADHARDHRPPIELVKIKCMLCGSVSYREARWERRRRKQCKAGPFCGKSCAGKWSRQQQINNGMSNLRT